MTEFKSNTVWVVLTSKSNLFYIREIKKNMTYKTFNEHPVEVTNEIRVVYL